VRRQFSGERGKRGEVSGGKNHVTLDVANPRQAGKMRQIRVESRNIVKKRKKKKKKIFEAKGMKKEKVREYKKGERCTSGKKARKKDENGANFCKGRKMREDLARGSKTLRSKKGSKRPGTISL